MTPRNCALLGCAFLLLVGAGAALAQGVGETVYTIGIGDRLRVSVWQEPTLDREVDVGIDGSIVLPLVGTIRAAGYTASALSQVLTDRYSLYKRDISQVEVVVIEFNSREIFVSGEVAVPGRYSFQEIPDLWSVIMKAGGPTASAYLGEVRILRGEGEGMRSISVDLSSYLLGGDRQALPRLQARDTVYIPRTSVISADVFGGKTVYVFGEVAKPGAYLIGPAETVVGALLLAGGPTPLADRNHVRLVRLESDRRVVTEFDLDDYFRYGDGRHNPPLRPGDTIELSQSRGNRFRSLMQNITPGLTFVTATVSAILIYDRLSDNN